MRRAPLVAGVLILLASAVSPAAAGPLTASEPVQVSSTSPYAPDCGLTAAGGTLFLDSEVEPRVDVSPVDGDGDGIVGDVLVGIWQQDRWSNGGARGNAAAVSFDGGASWETFTFPGVTRCTGGSFDRASDPWLSFSPNGDLHVMHLVVDAADFSRSGMMVQKIPAVAFADGDISESEIPEPILIAFADKEDLHDKNALTADPFDPNFAYAVWTLLDLPPGAIISPDGRILDEGLGEKGPALFSRTTDGGQTWSEPEVLYNPGAGNATTGTQIVVDDLGTLFAFFNEILFFRNDDGGGIFEFNLAVKFSSDRGETWLPHGRPIRIAKMFPRTARIPAADENAGTRVRTGQAIPEVASDPSTGNLYAVWMDTRFSGGDHNDIAFTMSTDGGQTWSGPIKVNQTPDSLTGAAGHAFTPSVHAADDGTVSVSYYDFRNDTPGAGTDADLWLVHCHGACSDPANWADEARVTGASFDIQQAPFSGGFFLGDYVGLDGVGNELGAFYAEGGAQAPGDPSSVFYVALSP